MTTSQTSTVVGIFEDRTKAEQAVDQLRHAGFSDDQISFSAHGTSSGGLIAGLKSLFSGQGTEKDHVLDELTGMGMPQEDARYYQQEYQAGRSIVAVSGESRMQEAATLLSQYGARGAQSSATQMTDTRSTANTATSQQPTATGQEQRMQLREEQLQVYKQPVQTGEVALHKEVVTEQKTLNVPVTREEVYIERQPGSGQVAQTPIGDDETIRVPVSKEQVNVSKQTVAKEEVSIGKRQVQETKQVSDTVQREKARVERKGNAPIHGTNSDPFHPRQADVEDLLKEE